LQTKSGSASLFVGTRSESFPTMIVVVISGAAVMAVVGAGILVFF
jgi:hypothetical protein